MILCDTDFAIELEGEMLGCWGPEHCMWRFVGGQTIDDWIRAALSGICCV